MAEPPSPSSAQPALAEGLSSVLRRLDSRLERAVARAEREYGPEALGDAYRGLHVGAIDVVRLLQRDPAAPYLFSAPLERDQEEVRLAEAPRLARLQSAFDLSEHDLEVVAIALAPELDLRYERIYAYLQDDVTRRRPSVDLVLNLTCRTPQEKLAARATFAPDAPLRRHGLLRLITDPAQLAPPLLAHFLEVDAALVHFLVGGRGWSPDLAPCVAEVGGGEASLLEPEVAERVAQLAREEQRQGSPLRLSVPAGEAFTTAASIARAAEMPLLPVDLRRTPPSFEAAEVIQASFREARLHGALLCLTHPDALSQEARDSAARALRWSIENHPNPVVLAGWDTASEEPPVGRILPLSIPDPDAAVRRDTWAASASREGIPVSPDSIEAVASRFRLDREQIRRAASEAAGRHRLRNTVEAAGTDDAGGDLFEAARMQCRMSLASLARRVDPVYHWDDMVLPPGTIEQLREICERVALRDRVLTEWGFSRKLSLGRGVAALFSGPSGTGKTMAAEVVAGHLGLDLYRIDLAGVVSKYIGETEKNLERIFSAAAGSEAVLLFDEADALFGKRSEVQDSHDRYANIETAYLLQRMEEYEGVAILSTNLRTNMDDAFMRRLSVSVSFPVPDVEHRRRIWEVCWPAEAPRGDDVDLDFLAATFKLAGGNIKNIVLGAAYLAATHGTPVSMQHLVRATRREFQKMGKAVVESEFGVYAELGSPGGVSAGTANNGKRP